MALGSQDAIHPDTQATLLLCASFTKDDPSDFGPLTQREYNALALWLARHGRRPADLLETKDIALAADDVHLPATERVRRLLARGAQLAIALERWQRLGLWVVGRGEPSYPDRLRRVLRSAAPPLLFGVGDASLLDRGGLAIVGSRQCDEEGLAFARRVAERCAGAAIPVISGGAKGVDQAALSAALEAGGTVVTVVAESLDRVATSREAKEWIRCERLTLVSPYEPASRFTVGRAMGRNKLIYAFADYALVVRFAVGAGGTWAGAIERLSQNRGTSPSVPVFVRVAHNPPEGWRELRSRGALPFPEERFWQGTAIDVLRQAATAPEIPQPAVQEPATTGSASAVGVPSADGVLPGPTRTVAEPDAGSPDRTLSPVPTTDMPQVGTCYRRCLPLILRNLRPQCSARDIPLLARRLDLLPGQLKEWIRQAFAEGRVEKRNGKQVAYVVPEMVEPAAETEEPQTCYGRCLPLVLDSLQAGASSQDMPTIARQLEVLPGQLQQWVKQAVAAGRVSRQRKGRRQVYVDASAENARSLFHRGGGDAA